jgi:hypothetical protein
LATKERREHRGKVGEVFDGIYGITELGQEKHEGHEGKGRGRFRTEDCKGGKRTEGKVFDRITRFTGMGRKAGGGFARRRNKWMRRDSCLHQNRVRCPSGFFDHEYA